MKVRVKSYGIAREIAGSDFEIEINGKTVGDLRMAILTSYPALAGLSSLMIAVNAAYAEEDKSIGPADEVVLIPPVSGG